MAKYYIVNRQVKGEVIISKEKLTFDKGFAVTESEDTYENAKHLTTLGYQAMTEKEFKAYVKQLQDKAKEEAAKKAEEEAAAAKAAEEAAKEKAAKGDEQKGNEKSEEELKAEAEALANKRVELQKALDEKKAAWDSEEDEVKQAAIQVDIEALEAEIKALG